jgi:hypothetical protein
VPSSDGGPAREQRRLVSDAVEPVADHLARRDGSRLAQENHERGLERVFGILVLEEPAAHAPNHRAVTPHEGGKRHFVSMLDEPPQELSVGPFGSFSPEQGRAKVLKQLRRLSHRFVPCWAVLMACPLLSICPRRAV